MHVLTNNDTFVLTYLSLVPLGDPSEQGIMHGMCYGLQTHVERFHANRQADGNPMSLLSHDAILVCVTYLYVLDIAQMKLLLCKDYRLLI